MASQVFTPLVKIKVEGKVEKAGGMLSGIPVPKQAGSFHPRFAGLPQQYLLGLTEMSSSLSE